ncbi:MAG TPA: hypothetical protein VMJ10_14280 [Kofleriaceae bacterium]|nr:hypothetical protein [Kofleriaceae bacterium]
MKTILFAAALSLISISAAQAGPGQTSDCVDDCATTTTTTTPPPPPLMQPTAEPVVAPPAVAAPVSTAATEDDDGWHRPAGQRFTSGFRLGWMYLSNYDALNRKGDNGEMTSLKQQFGLKSPNMFLLGYEGFYRILGHSWLNVLMVGNVSVAGLDQSKFIPTASGLLGFEIQRSFELGVGINLTPDPQSPSHMIAAAGWTPKVGSIQTPIHFFYIPDESGVTDAMGHTVKGNSRMGATIGMNW